MEPLNKNWGSTWLQVFGEVYISTPDSQVWLSVHRHLRYQFDWPFIDEDK